MRAIAKWEDIPIFDSEEAEAGFWAENKPDLRLMETAVAGPTESAESVTITLRIDPDVLMFFRKQGRGYQTAINAVLRKYVEAQKS